jgi:hypothetical protein
MQVVKEHKCTFFYNLHYYVMQRESIGFFYVELVYYKQ